MTAAGDGIERLAGLPPEELDDTQRALYDRIVSSRSCGSGPGFPLTDGRGVLVGPFNAMLHSPELGSALAELGSAIRFRSGLSARVRELAILTVSAARSSEFEWYAHEQAALRAGVDASALDRLRGGHDPQLDDPVEQGAYELARALADREPIGDARYARLRDLLGTTAMTELAVLVGYYETLASMLALFEVGRPDGAAVFAGD